VRIFLTQHANQSLGIRKRERLARPDLPLRRIQLSFANAILSRYVDKMETLHVELPADLVQAANLDLEHLSADTTRSLALLLFREDKVSLGRAAQLCQTPIEEFIQFAGRHDVALHYGLRELEKDRRNMSRLGL
jgi:predicted HTH domain antitoxin